VPPPANDRFAASGVLRRCDFKGDRAQVRRWAREPQLAHPKPNLKATAPIRRWHRAQIGEGWPLEAAPPRWFPASKRRFPRFHRLEACRRRGVGAKLYERENRRADDAFLPAACRDDGLPLELDVDFDSCCFTPVPAARPQLGAARHCYGVAFRDAPTPHAKGQVQREPPFWQNPLPAACAREPIADLETANPHGTDLRQHRPPPAVPRELQRQPQQAWDTAKKEKRSVRRPAPRCPWGALRLESTPRAQSRRRRPRAHRGPTPPDRSPAAPQSHPLPASHRS